MMFVISTFRMLRGGIKNVKNVSRMCDSKVKPQTSKSYADHTKTRCRLSKSSISCSFLAQMLSQLFKKKNIHFCESKRNIKLHFNKMRVKT